MIRALLLRGGAAVALAAVPATAQVAPDGDPTTARGTAARAGPRVSVAPYIEAAQTLAWDLNGGDAVTYTQVAAGVDAAVRTNRVQAQASYRYDHLFAYEDGQGDTTSTPASPAPASALSAA